jgi:transposase-like protein
METSPSPPQTLLEAIKYFSDPDTFLKFVVELRWPHGVTCPRCQALEPTFLATRRVWKCKGCKKQFSVKVGTIFEDSPLPLEKWLAAIWLIANAKNGISSYEIHRGINVTQKSAWFMLHRIRLAMKSGSFEKLKGTVESDETFIGGKVANMHKNKRPARHSQGGVGKSIVMALLERNGKIRAKVLPNIGKQAVQGMVHDNVEPGSNLFTDTAPAYVGLDADFVHETVNHMVQYVRGKVHTNGLENFWSLLKRMIRGTYIRPDAYHLLAYLDEESFRFNERHGNDGKRFLRVLAGIVGRRLTWKRLTGKDDEAVDGEPDIR